MTWKELWNTLITFTFGCAFVCTKNVPGLWMSTFVLSLRMRPLCELLSCYDVVLLDIMLCCWGPAVKRGKILFTACWTILWTRDKIQDITQVFKSALQTKGNTRTQKQPPLRNKMSSNNSQIALKWSCKQQRITERGEGKGRGGRGGQVEWERKGMRRTKQTDEMVWHSKTSQADKQPQHVKCGKTHSPLAYCAN